MVSLAMNHNLFARIERSVDRPGAPFIWTPDGTVVSYGEAMAASARYAHALTDLGVRPGDRIAVQVEKSPDTLLLYLGALRAGAVYLPLSTDYTDHEVAYFLSDAEPALLICDPDRRERSEALAGAQPPTGVATLGTDQTGTLVDRAKAAPGEFDTIVCGESDLAAILYTSGTTGKPKGAMLSHGNLASNAAMLKDEWRFTKDDTLLHALPIFHTHGLFVAVNVTLLTGSALILLPKFDLGEMMRLLPRATVIMGVPTFYTRFLSHPGFTREATAHMRLFVSGSAPLSAETHKAFAERTGHRILERYGMTETNMNTGNPYDGERRAGTVGFPFPGVELRITDRGTGDPLPPDEVGMIEVRGPNVFQGYWHKSDKTAEAFREDGFFITGDLGKIDQDGYVHIVGRDKDLIITGGFNVYPAEVEAAIDAIAGVAESAVIGLPHPDFGEGVAAVVALKQGVTLTQADILAALGSEIAKYKTPKRVFFVDSLPRNRMSKIEKKMLREQFSSAFTNG